VVVGEAGSRGVVTQTASLLGLSLHGPTVLCGSLATVTHGAVDSQREEGVPGLGTGFREDSCAELNAGRLGAHVTAIHTDK